VNEWTASLYRCFDADGRLLYVGISSSVPMRLKNHRYQSSWFPLVARVTVTPPRPWSAIRGDEREVIASELPLFNRPARRGSPLPTIEAVPS
jgi:hypothetical protein